MSIKVDVYVKKLIHILNNNQISFLSSFLCRELKKLNVNRIVILRYVQNQRSYERFY